MVRDEFQFLQLAIYFLIFLVPIEYTEGAWGAARGRLSHDKYSGGNETAGNSLIGIWHNLTSI